MRVTLLETLMITPPASPNCRAAACAQSSTAFTFVSNSLSKWGTSNPSRGRMSATPALFTRTSTRLNARVAAANSSPTAAASATSARTATAAPPATWMAEATSSAGAGAVIDHDLGPVGGKAAGDRRADPACRPVHERNLPRQSPVRHD